ncbi:MAG: elongation factor EF-2 [Candidatus Aenigmatarchaeota archaeon]|nr:MAG: elongation factor EF-2 [Candidatus Aenigmarchaeota archaeon]
MAKKSLTEQLTVLMKKPKHIRNIGIAAHIDHGKTTLTDNLLAGAGMLSEEIAGTALWTDFDKQEQERGITIYSANVSMIHPYKDDHYLINLIDTPGHVDFGGDVTRAMRAVDGVVIVACAVEGVMPQTETVIRQALKERVKPVLFINKVDRLIKELKLTPEQMQERFAKIIKTTNMLIQKYSEKQFAKDWIVKVEDGSVAFGSAYRNWAISFPFMKEYKITFKDIVDYCSQDKDKELAKKAPLHKIVLNMVIEHLPNPIEAQKYRIEKIWHGDINSEVGKQMTSCDPSGQLSMIVTKVVPDPHAGIVATCRIFSGTAHKGQMVHLIGQAKDQRLQQVSIYKGAQRIQMDEIPSGNIIGVVGLTDAFSGETVTEQGATLHAFESIKHIFEPVVTKSIEPKNPKDLPKLINFLRQVSREDPTLKITINEETGEYLVSGLGELHIDAKIERPLRESGIDVTTSPPIVVYRESVRGISNEIEGKSPNKHNRFYMVVEPLEREIYEAIADDKIPEGRVKRTKELAPILQEYGLPKEEAKKCLDIYNRNLFIDATKGIQYLTETMELVLDAFESVCKEGPLAREPLSAVKVKIVDAKLHEDAIHRGPAQVYPAVREAIKTAIINAEPTFLEPIQIIRVDTPEELMGNVMSEIQNRRGQVENVENEQGVAIIRAKMPVAEMFGFEASLKSATGGKGFYSLIDVKFEFLPKVLYEKVKSNIRNRKGLRTDAEIA